MVGELLGVRASRDGCSGGEGQMGAKEGSGGAVLSVSGGGDR